MSQLTGQNKKAWDEYLLLCKRIQDGNAPLPDETEAQKQGRIKKLLAPGNYQEFINYYFGAEGDLAPIGWFHKQAVKDILIDKKRNNILEWPRETAKSVTVDVFFPFYLLVTNWLTGLILASETEDKANKLIGDLQAQLEHNRRIINDFGDFGISGSWGSGYWQTKDGIGFWAFGLGQNPAGVRNGFKRPNLGIVDDADSKKRAKNQQLTVEAVNWIKGEFMGCLQTKDRMFIYANNRVAANGLTAHMVGDVEPDDPKDPNYNHIKVYWTEDPKTHLKLMPEEGGVSCWPENYSKKHAIERIQDMGYVNAMRQLYHEEIPQGTIFKEEQFLWVDPLPLDQYEALVSYTDPSFGDSKTSDFKAIVLLGLTKRKVDVLYVWCRQTNPQAMIEAIYNIKEDLDTLNPSFYDVKANIGYKQSNVRFYIEANMTQKMILKPLITNVADERGTAWEPRYDERKKPDKQGRIESLSPLFETGRIRFNAKLRQTADMQKLKEQFINFPNGHDDGPDAVEGGWFYLMNKVKRSTGGTQARVGNYTKKHR